MAASFIRAAGIFAALCIWLSPAGADAEEPSARSDAAIHDALKAGRALCKVISRNDAGLTGSHQSGLYLPKPAWRLFSSAPPAEEKNRREEVEITWPDGAASSSIISWYGKGSRSEYRLTRTGAATSTFLGPDAVGDLLVLVPLGEGKFHAHVLRTEEEAAALCAALGIQSGGRWELYEKRPLPEEPARNGAARYTAWAQRAAEKYSAFPDGRVMAALARQAVAECAPRILQQSADNRLLAWTGAEYAVYREIERRVCDAQVHHAFASVEEFLAAASTIMNRRKSRAGHSLEEHVEYLLCEAGIVFDAQATIDGKVRPDILLPGKSAYDNPQHPAENLLVLGLKTTCRDRWRQVLNEGKRVAMKHLLTLQPAMSHAQLTEMREAHLQLIVPAPLHAGYDLPDGCRLLTVQEFVDELKRRFPRQ